MSYKQIKFLLFVTREKKRSKNKVASKSYLHESHLILMLNIVFSFLILNAKTSGN